MVNAELYLALKALREHMLSRNVNRNGVSALVTLRSEVVLNVLMIPRRYLRVRVQIRTLAETPQRRAKRRRTAECVPVRAYVGYQNVIVVLSKYFGTLCVVHSSSSLLMSRLFMSSFI